jgi:regulatory protein
MYKAKAPISPERAIIKVEELCAKAERCSEEIRQKLYRMGLEYADIERIINSLIERRFLDDKRFTRAFVRDKVAFARWGKRKIAQALYVKRIDRDTIREALDGIDEEMYMSNLQHIINLKAKTLADADSYEGKTKLFRFAASRGFEPDLVASVIRQTFSN